MINGQILNLLNPLIKKKIKLNEQLELCGITSVLQDAKKNEIVFYKIDDSEISEQLFLERLKDKKEILLILNRQPHGLTNPVNILIIDEENFLQAQKIILDELYPYYPEKIKLIGITGTNGKTTTSVLAREIASQNGFSSITGK